MLIHKSLILKLFTLDPPGQFVFLAFNCFYDYFRADSHKKLRKPLFHTCNTLPFMIDSLSLSGTEVQI